MTWGYGKGRKSSEVGLGKRSRQLLHKFYRHLKASPDEQHVFVGRGGKPMTAEGQDKVLYRLRDAARHEGVRVGAHVRRHTFAFSYIEAGGDVFRLSRLLGHSSVATTQGYLTAFTSRNARKGPSVFDGME